MRDASHLAKPDLKPHHGGLPYRSDIDGLRAVAVLSVILFHSGLPFVTGGYAGVDVFFVISGYLITGGIWRDLDRGSFSIIGFYERRVRRIYPALLALVAVVLVFGTVILMPDELKNLGAQSAAAVAFSSNLLFWLQTDYFATAAELEALLHTWSLAVEEQFYLVIAPLMVLVFRRGRTALVLAALCGVSFIASCISASLDPAGNYYLPYNRAWELLIGSLVAVVPLPAIRTRAAELLAALALAAIVLPMFLLDRDSVFPAWNALPTCLGSAAIIAIGQQHSTSAGRALGVAPMRWVGLISYSLYLVHWPILVFARYQLLRDPTPLEMTALITGMFAAAWLSWRFVEIPFRQRRVPRVRLFGEAAAVSAVIAVAGIALFLLNGLPSRFPGLAQRDKSSGRPGCFLQKGWTEWNVERCLLTHGPGPVVLLWGDSHANHYASALSASGARSKVLLYASAGCPPVLNISVKGRPNCRANNAHALDIIRSMNVRKVVLSAAWEYDFSRADNGMALLGQTVRALRRQGIHVTLIGDGPVYPFSNPQFLAARLARRPNPTASFYVGVKNDFSFNQRLARAAGPDRFFDPLRLLCRDGLCLAFHRGKLTMRDNGHLSMYGASLEIAAMPGVFD